MLVSKHASKNQVARKKKVIVLFKLPKQWNLKQFQV